MPKLPKILPFLALLTFTAGCYRYVPVTPSAVGPGTEVRTRLTEDGQREVRSFMGSDTDAVEGSLVAWNRDGVSLLVQSEIRRDGFPPTAFTDTLELLPQHVQSVQVRELDGWRTAGTAALVVGGAVVAVLAPRALGGDSESGDGEGGGEGDPTDPNAQILIRFPLSFSFW